MKVERARLQRLLMGPGVPPDALVRVRDCSFTECSVAGEFRVAPGVELQNVIFQDVMSPDAMIINTQTALTNVVVKGSRKCGGLWVKPSDIQDPARKHLCEDWAATAAQGSGLMLDFSEYLADDTEVIGLPINRLKWNRELHFPLSMQGRSAEDWEKLDLEPTSFWSMKVKRLRAFKAKEGVFALPLESHQKYDAARKEMPRVVEAGFVALS